jgi:GNAT superfamily N-acetyltransferase
MAKRQGGRVAVWEIAFPMDVDTEALARLLIVAWGHQPTTDEVSEKALRLRAELDGLDPARRAVVVAGDPSDPAGWCKTWRDETDAKTWWFAGLVVDPNRRRQGIATALERRVEVYAKDHGAEVLRSQTHADNSASIQFHEAIGYVNDGETTATDGDRLINFHRCLR